MTIIDLDAPIPIAKSVSIIFPQGGGTLNTVRGLIRNGRLPALRIGNRFFVTRRQIQEMKSRCQVNHEAPIYGTEKNDVIGALASGSRADTGSSSTIDNISPRDALAAKLKRLKQSSANTQN